MKPSTNRPIFLDYHSTTPVDPEVLEQMLPYFSVEFGNAASKSHSYGWTALEAVEKARLQIAGLAGSEAGEIVFTSGATESINLALKGTAESRGYRGHVITTATEHPAVLDTCDALEKHGVAVTVVDVNRDGTLDLNRVTAAFRSDTFLVSVIHANNEIGTIHPVEEIAKIAHEHGAMIHVDSAQSLGKIPVAARQWNLDLISCCAHKLYGPKGVGALIMRRKLPPIKMVPQIHGGHHQRGLRSGTLNVPGIVGFGAACEIARDLMPTESERLQGFRDLMLGMLRAEIPDLIVNGSMESRLSNNLNLSFPGIQGELLLPGLRGKVAVSSGSACSSEKPGMSHVLKGIGVSDELARNSIRIGLGRFNTQEDVKIASREIGRVVREISI